MIPLDHLPNLPTGPCLYVLLAAIVVTSGVPVVALAAAAEPIVMTVIALDGHGRLSIVAVLVVTVVASVLGDALSYGLGRWFGPRLLRARIFRHSRHRIVGAQRSLQRQGTMTALLIQRWIPPTRGLVPALLGAAEKPLGVFISCSALSAAVWGPVIILGSYVGGPGLLLAMPAAFCLVPAAHAAHLAIRGRRSQPRQDGANRFGPALPGAAKRPVAAPVALALLGVAPLGFIVLSGSHAGGAALILAMPAVMLLAAAVRAARRLVLGGRNGPHSRSRHPRDRLGSATRKSSKRTDSFVTLRTTTSGGLFDKEEHTKP